MKIVKSYFEYIKIAWDFMEGYFLPARVFNSLTLATRAVVIEVKSDGWPK